MGLYDPAYEHDGCGVACLARLDGRPAHETISRAIETLDNLEHRGAEGADAETGDGAGILTQIPDAFLRAELGFALPEAGRYAVAVCMLPREEDRRLSVETVIERLVTDGGQRVLGWRDVPVDMRVPGPGALSAMPVIRQLLIGSTEPDQDAFERRLYGIRRRAERGLGDAVAFPSFSSRTMVLKGMLSAPQLPRFYPDLCDERFASALAIVHSRFSTNTFPSWALAHPFRFIAHNGEINTLRGNVNWMRAREHVLGEFAEVRPVIPPGASDSASFDAVLELLVLAGRPLAHAVMMMVPEAWEGRDDLDEELRGFYAYHEKLMEPWDGPASITFSRRARARREARPQRPAPGALGADRRRLGRAVLGVGRDAGRARARDPPRAPEAGRAVDRRPATRRAARRPPGRVRDRVAAAVRDVGVRGDDPARGRRARRAAARSRGVARAPANRFRLYPRGLRHPDRPDGRVGQGADRLDGRRRRAARAERPGAVAVLLLQAALRAGHQPGDRLAARGPGDEPDDVARARAGAARRRAAAARRLRLPSPVLTTEDMARVVASPLPWVPLDATWPTSLGVAGLEAAVERLVGEAATAAAAGADILVIGDRRVGPAARRSRRCWPWPRSITSSCAAGCARAASLVVDSGEPREVHHIACLVGYGADAVHPWLAGDAIVPALGKGLLKVMSKMGVSTVSAYRGAQVFEAIGLGPEVIERHFVGTPSKLGGLGLRGLAREVLDPARAHVRAGRRALPLAARRRAPQLEPGDRRRAAARRVAALRRGRGPRVPARRAARPARVPRARPDRDSTTSSRRPRS